MLLDTRNLYKSILCVGFFGLLSTSVSSQACDITLNIPADLTICEPMNVNLDGDIVGDYISFEWEGTNGFYNNTNLSPSVFTNVNTTYTLIAYAITGGNTIINGDFENGDTDFTTDYILGTVSCYGAGYLDCEGTYGIVTDPNLGHTNFASCGDHTTGSGNMMVVNGAQDFQNIWCQEVSVTSGVSYVFSAWATSVNGSSPAILQYSIDGMLLGDNFNLSSALCQWQEFNELWVAPSTTTLEICVTNQNTSTGGNDFALDDIFFGEVCEMEESFDVTLYEFEVIPETPEILTCNLEEVAIQVNVEPIGNYSFNWSTTDGNILSNSGDQNILVNQAGTYTVDILHESGCLETVEIVVQQNIDIPSLNISGDFELDCDNPFVEFEAEVGASDPEIMWYDEDNNLIGNTFTIAVNTAGTYTAIVVDQANGCTNTQSWDVINSTSAPMTTIFTNQDLGCANASILIYSESDEEVTIYNWTLPDGTVQASADLDALEIDTAGLYILQAIHPNGCSSVAQIQIEFISSNLQVIIESPVISCLQDSFQLFVHSSEDIASVIWSNDLGYNAQGDTVLIAEDGNYFMQIIDTLGCELLDTVEVISDVALPIVTVTDAVLTCANNQIQLAPEFLSSFSTAMWTNEDGEIIPGDTILVSSVGEYTLNIIGANGCDTSVTSLVTADINFPESDLSSTLIDCNNPLSTLTANVTANASYSLQWLYNSIVISNANAVDVSDPGIYFVEIVTEDGCSIMDSVIVNADLNLPIFDIVPDAVMLNCDNPEILITLSGTNSSDVIIWTLLDNTNVESEELMVDQAGVYSVEAFSANGCSNTQVIEIFQDLAQPEFTVDSDLLTCEQVFTALFIESDEELEYYLNDAPLSVPTDEIYSGGSYTITALASNGCLDTVIYTVPIDTLAPFVNLVGNPIDCINTESQILASGSNDLISYTWFDEQGNILSNQSALTVSDAGSYQVVVSSANACTAEAEYLVIADQEIPEFTLNTTPFSCTQDTATINLITNPDFNVNWIGYNEESFSLDVFEAGEYSFEITNPANGCNLTETIAIEKSVIPLDNIEFVTTSRCGEGFASFEITNISGGTPGYEIFLNNEPSTMSAQLLEGETQISIVDELGCSLDTFVEIELISDLLVSDFTDINVVWQSEQTLNLTTNRDENEILSIEWSPVGLFDCQDCLEQTITVSDNLSITVTIEDVYGCVEIRQINISTEFITQIFIPNIFSPNRDNQNDNFTVFGADSQVEEILLLEIYDRWGNRVYLNKNFPVNSEEEGWNGDFKFQQAAAGVYAYHAVVLFKTGESQSFAGDITLMR